MSHLQMTFLRSKDEEDIQTYSLICNNESAANWIFYVYQTLPVEESEIFSLAWFASPYKISPGSSITFKWGINYSFVWGDTGLLADNVVFNAGGDKDCSLSGNNITTFSLDDGAPQLSDPIPGGKEGTLTINVAPNVPNLEFSTGIAMSGQGAFVQQALENAPQLYTPTPMYWIAAGNSIQMGQVLAQTVTQSAEVDFPPNVYTRTATLGSDNQWIIS